MKSFFSLKEASSYYRIGLPIFIAQLSQTGMTFADTAMTGQYNAEDMAAIAVAGSIWAPIALLGIGCLLALPPLGAQFAGAGHRAETAHLLRQGIYLSLGLSCILMLLFQVLSWHLELFGLEPSMAQLAGGYLRALLWGLPGFMLFVSQRSFLEAFSRTRPAMVIGLLGLTLNVPCNYVLIYGRLGLPALGAVGCGLASSLCYWFMAMSMWLYLRRNRDYRDLEPLFSPLWSNLANKGLKALDWGLIFRIFAIGFPGALALFFEVSLFALSAILLAPLGTVMVAGNQVAMNFSALVFMVPLAIGMTATIRVGFLLGARRVESARLSARTAICLSVFFALLMALLIVLLRERIVAIYTSDAPVAALAAHLLLYMAAYQVIDGLQMAGIGILRGYNDTRIISIICFVAYWIIGLPLGYTLARTNLIVPQLGATGFWICYLAALGFGALCYLLRVHWLHSLSPEKALALSLSAR